jgi:EmrB/QacA subfamily drug resistance transporter
VAVFSWTSLLCAQAPNVLVLVAFRVLQGVGGGALMPLQLIILARAAGAQRFGRVLSFSMLPILLAPICGPILGGWLIDSFGWQSIFLINVPIGLCTLVIAGLILPDDAPAPVKSLDVVGMALLSPGLVLLLYGMSLLPAHGTIADRHVWAPAAIGLILIGAFIVHAVRRGDRALLDMRLLRYREVAAAECHTLPFRPCLLRLLPVVPSVLSAGAVQNAIRVRAAADSANTGRRGRHADRGKADGTTRAAGRGSGRDDPGRPRHGGVRLRHQPARRRPLGIADGARNLRRRQRLHDDSGFLDCRACA